MLEEIKQFLENKEYQHWKKMDFENSLQNILQGMDEKIGIGMDERLLKYRTTRWRH